MSEGGCEGVRKVVSQWLTLSLGTKFSEFKCRKKCLLTSDLSDSSETDFSLSTLTNNIVLGLKNLFGEGGAAILLQVLEEAPGAKIGKSIRPDI